MIVYDLDGVLLDTRAANFAAYRCIGVDPPPNFHVRPWEDWCQSAVHDAKNLKLKHYLDLVRPLPLFQQAWRDASCLKSWVVSSASAEAFDLLNIRFHLSANFAGIRHGLRLPERIDIIHSLGGGIYYDDSRETCDAVNKLEDWQACQVLPYSFPPQVRDSVFGTQATAS